VSERVLVIGSNSFSGADFVDLLLDEGYEVIGISRSPEKEALFARYHQRADRRGFTFHQLDLNHDLDAVRALVEQKRPAYVVNFASQSEVAPSWQHPEHWFQTNTVALAALANFLKDCVGLRRYVHISTPEVYGSCRGSVAEEEPFRPSTPYAASRAAAELFLQTLVQRYRFPVSMVRAANVYGAHQQLHKLLPRAAIYPRLGRVIELHGGGRARRSFIHIRDVSRGELAVMRDGAVGQAYNLSTTVIRSVRDLVRKVCELQGYDFESATRDVDDRPGQDDAYLLDCRRAGALGWAPEVGLEQGLAEVVAWVDREWAVLRHRPLEYEHRP